MGPIKSFKSKSKNFYMIFPICSVKYHTNDGDKSRLVLFWSHLVAYIQKMLDIHPKDLSCSRFLVSLNLLSKWSAMQANETKLEIITLIIKHLIHKLISNQHKNQMYNIYRIQTSEFVALLSALFDGHRVTVQMLTAIKFTNVHINNQHIHSALMTSIGLGLWSKTIVRRHTIQQIQTLHREYQWQSQRTISMEFEWKYYAAEWTLDIGITKWTGNSSQSN